MKILAPSLFFFLAAAAYGGESFDERVQRANDLEKTAEGQAYQDAMWPLVGPVVADVTGACIPRDADLEGQTFTLVMTLSADGSPRDLEIQPSTTVTKCIASGMASAPFPKPPPGFSASGLPLVFVFHIHFEDP